MAKKIKTKKLRKIAGIILLIISLLLIIAPIVYVILVFSSFEITITNEAGYSLIFQWLIGKIVLVILGIIGIIFSIKLIGN